MKSPKHVRLLTVLAVLSACTVLCLIYGRSILLGLPASEIFRQHVVDPIPRSVTDIKVDQPKKRGGYGYVLRFGINRADLRLILESQPVPFSEAQIANDLSDGSLYWRWKGPPLSLGGHGLTLYGDGRKPSWYDLPSWDNPEVYALVRYEKDWNSRDIQVLIYNPSLEQAYFIVFEYGGNAIWG